ncbi:uncharacterized protein LOC142312700 [Anomaloglossus baeobatrachus]|uniref:uncharacterized protein LOC142312700 n=1 Tax=Anomaloglossus baeobatrachus TaxID=238106 RepID=UPI003F50AAE7
MLLAHDRELLITTRDEIKDRESKLKDFDQTRVVAPFQTKLKGIIDLFEKEVIKRKRSKLLRDKKDFQMGETFRWNHRGNIRSKQNMKNRPQASLPTNPNRENQASSGEDFLSSDPSDQESDAGGPFALRLESYVRDSTDLILQLEELNIPEGTILVTMDIESLYTSISHDLGMGAVSYFLFGQSTGTRDHDEFLMNLLSLVLNLNYFVFDRTFYKQVSGTAMGARCAPSYANIYLGWWEETKVRNMPAYKKHVFQWFRYLDDVLMLWTGSWEECEEFISELNNNMLNIYLTSFLSLTSVDFLDLKLSLEGSRIATDLFRKPTSTNSFLHYSSFHPEHLRRGIPKGQFLRLRRNCSNNVEFCEQSKELTRRFQARGYPKKKPKGYFNCRTKKSNLWLNLQLPQDIHWIIAGTVPALEMSKLFYKKLGFCVKVTILMLTSFLLASCEAPQKPAVCSVIEGFQSLNGRDGRDGRDGPPGSKGEPGIPGEPGKPGLKGDSGVTGKAGPQGLKGERGDTGINGISGPQGLKGEKGSLGPSGATGAVGVPGAKGATGATGATGTPGIKGAAGAKGDKGDLGSQGLKGDRGTTGEKGAPGIPGTKGAIGPPGTGATGAKGDKGDGGLQGIKGEKGSVGGSGVAGTPGAAGAKGATGSTGQQGIQGVKGAAGAKGDKGDAGPQGLKGNDGSAGAKGSPGNPGAAGSKGERGLTGPPGTTGAMGTAGVKGQIGNSGIQGVKGDRGLPGSSGAAGAPGIAGAKGATGAPGIPGAKGTAGAKGDPDTTLSTKIVNLEKKIADLEKNLISLKKVCYFQSGVVTSGSKIYVTNGKEGNYDTAKATCQGAQGTMPNPLNSAENAALLQIVKAGGKRFFLGMNDIKEEGNYIYTNGNRLSYKNWNVNEPNGGRKENCVEIIEQGQWIDKTCDAKNIIVCEF